MPLPSLAAIAVRKGTFQQGGGKHPPPPAMLDQKKPGRIRVKQSKYALRRYDFYFSRFFGSGAFLTACC